MAFSPLGKGFLSGGINKDRSFEKNDFRNVVPRFSKENLEQNQAPIDYIRTLAQEKNATPSQIALAWLLAQRDYIVLIFGTTKQARVVENIGAMDISLSSDEIERINKRLDSIEIKGDRYPPELAKRVGK